MRHVSRSGLAPLFRLVLICMLLAAAVPRHVFALSSGDLTFTLITPYMAQDSNDSCNAGPKAMYIEVLVTNPAGGTGSISNLTASLSAFAGAAGVTLDSGESGTRYIGTLADGASFPLYFYINYPCQAGSNPPAISSTFTVTVSDGVTAPLASPTLSITTRSELSANAGGQVLSSTIGPGAVVGQIIPMTVNYDFGNPGGVQVAMIQPAGNVSFDGGCFRLMSVDVTATTGFTAGLTTSSDDRLYFTSVNGASSNTATVVYYFKMLCSGASTTANPFSDLTSGSQQKYTGNFGTCSAAGAVCPSYPAPTNPFTVTKTASPSSLPTGGAVTYTVTISNPSAYAAKIDKIIDTLPAGVTFTAISAGSGVTAANSSSVPSAGATGTITFAGIPTTSCVGGVCNGSYSIAANGTLTLVYTANVTSSAGVYTNSARAMVETTTLNSATANVTVGSADIAVSKSASSATPNVNSNVTFTISATNNGPGAASGVQLTDLLPAGLAFVSATPPGTTTYNPATGVWNIGSLANGATVSLQIVATVTQPGAITNSASVTASTPTDPNSANNSASAIVTGQQADLAVTKTVDNPNVPPGSNMTYTVQVRNNGPSAATGIQVTDALPAGVTYISHTPSQGSYSTATGLWSVGNLANGASASLAITVRVDSAAPITNSAGISAPAQYDPVSANNGDSITTPSALADLAVTKTASSATASVNSNVAFTVQVANNGPTAASGVQLTDLLPAGLAFVSATPSVGSYNNATGVWNVGALANGASATLQIVATVTQAGALINQAGISASNEVDPNAANDAASATVTGQQADLAVAKTVDNATPNVNSNVTFSVQVVNTGSSTASGVQLTDVLPAGLAFVSATPSVGSYNNATGVWNVGALANGASATLQIVATVTQPGAISNTAAISASSLYDPNSANNSATATLTGQQADLAVAKSVDNASPNVGANVTFTIQVSNNGPSTATGVAVTDLLPAGLTFVSATPSAGSYNNATGVWSVGTLNASSSAALALVATVTGAGPFTNTASVTSSGQYDPNSANNSSSASLTGQQADLAVTKTVNNATPNVGTNVTYTIQISNNGPSTATGVDVTDLLPAALAFVSATPSQGSYTSASGVWNVGTLANGASATLQIVATVTQPGAISNSAIMTASDQPDPNNANNAASATLTGQQADLAVTKSVDNAIPNVGANVTFTVQVGNNGPSNATGVAVTDLLPAGLAFVSATPSAGSYTSASGVWNVGALANGASATLQIVATVTQPGAITNIATLTTHDQPDAIPANDSGSASLNGQQADLAVAKSVDNAAPNVGANVTYTIQVGNNGPSNATGVEITDLLPAGLAFVSATPSQGSYTSATGVWNVGTLANGASATLQIVASVTQPGAISNSATISASDQPDPSSADNTSSVTVTGQQADLAITKTVDNAIPNVGSDVTYTIQVSNNGPSAASGVVVSDLLPAGLAFVSATPSQGSYTSATSVWNVGALANGASATLQIVATVTQPGAISNSATISAVDQPDPDSANNNASVTITGQQADLAITKTVDNATPNVGANVTFTVTVSNNGPSTATGVVVSDLLPAGLSFVSATASSGVYTLATGDWTIGSLANGASATLQIVATVTQPGTISNTASIKTVNQPDPNSANNSATATLTGQQADLAITKTVDNATPNVGTNVTYTIQISNNGPTGATGVAVTDLLPAGLAFVSATPSTGTYTSASGVWNVGALANGASATLQIVATVTQPGAISNMASISASDQPDPNSANNSATATLTGQQADLAVTKTVDNATPNVGANVSFTVQVGNNGPSSATGVVVTDLLPAGLAFVSATPSAGSYNNASGVWSVGALANGASATLQIVATVTQPGAISNTASISESDQFDPDAANGSGSASLNGQQADLSIEKFVDDEAPNVGANVTYTIQVANNGPSAASGVAVTDLLPAELTFVSATPSQGSYASATGIWNVGSLANGATATLQIVATVTQPGSISNSATITSSDQPDPDSANNTSTASLFGHQADLAITKTVDNATPNVGANVTYTIQVSNNGPSTATGVEVTDLLPAGLAFVSANPAAAYDSATGIWTVDGVDAGAGATLQIVARVTQPGAITNSATISAVDQPDPDSANNNASVTITGQQADLAITKSASAASASIGANVTFSIQVSNNGPSNASGVVVSDVLPAGLSLVSATPSQGSYTSATGVWNVGSLANGSFATLTIVATITQPGSIVNTAAITSGDQPDPNAANNTSSATVTGLTTDLALTKSVNQPQPNVGDNVTFTVTIANNGPGDATGIVVSDLLPAGLTFMSATTSNGSIYTAGSGAWNVGALANGVGATLQIVARVDQAGTITNQASISAGDQPDPNSINNSASASLGGQLADLMITKTVDNDITPVGSQVTFTIVVTNNGPTDASGVAVTDALPYGLNQVSASATTGSYSGDVWTIGNLANGASATLTVVATMTVADTVVNTATISKSDQPDPDSSNNESWSSVTGLEADLAITKSVDNATPNVGDTVTYTIVVSNNGPADTTGVEVSDPLPAGLALVSAQASAGSYAAQTGLWSVGDLGSFAGATLTIVARVTQPGTIGNTATITGSDIPDPSSQDNTSTSTIVAQSADLAVTKQVNNVKPQIGGNVIYTITVHNNGPDAATGVTVADKLPVGLTFVASTPSQGSYDANSGSWNVGSLANGATATMNIQVLVAAVGTIVNTAQISAADQFDPNSTPANNAPAENDQSQASLAAQPTAILLDHFTAHSSGAGVLLNWRTALELDTWGFEIYRSSTGQRDDAVRVTPTLIPAQGRGQAGAEYTWVDTAAQPGSVYRYWLVEIDRNGIRTEYGPASSATGAGATTYRVALPLVVR